MTKFVLGSVLFLVAGCAFSQGLVSPISHQYRDFDERISLHIDHSGSAVLSRGDGCNISFELGVEPDFIEFGSQVFIGDYISKNCPEIGGGVYVEVVNHLEHGITVEVSPNSTSDEGFFAILKQSGV